MRRSIKYKRKEIRLNPRILRGVVMRIACVVLFWTVYALILPAITQEKQANCGMEAHVHSEVCYDDAGVLRCDLPEHTHTDACYADPSADLQTPADWEPEIKEVELSGDWAQDSLAVAKPSLGIMRATRTTPFRMTAHGTPTAATASGQERRMVHGIPTLPHSLCTMPGSRMMPCRSRRIPPNGSSALKRLIPMP